MPFAGGDLQSYLPHKGGRVLCGCFSLDLNKRAPVEIDVGDLPDVIKYAHALVDQGGVIPVFLKKGIHAGEYVGRFRPVALSEDPSDLYPARARRPDAVAVIYLESVRIGFETLGYPRRISSGGSTNSRRTPSAGAKSVTCRGEAAACPRPAGRFGVRSLSSLRGNLAAPIRGGVLRGSSPNACLTVDGTVYYSP